MGDDSALLPRDVEFLVFEAAGVTMAVEASQVAEIVKTSEAIERGIPVVSLDEILTRNGRTSPVPPVFKDALLFRDGEKIRGLGVTRLDSIQPAAVEMLRPLPALLALGGGPMPFWGTMTRGTTIVLLIDLRRLTAHFPCPASQLTSAGGHA